MVTQSCDPYEKIFCDCWVRFTELNNTGTVFHGPCQITFVITKQKLLQQLGSRNQGCADSF